MHEPDRIQWRDEKTGLYCLMVRHPQLGVWRGYVGVPEDHSFYWRGYQDCEFMVFHEVNYSAAFDASEGGDIYYLDVVSGSRVPLWFFGFAAESINDYIPEVHSPANSNIRLPQGQYKDLGFIRTEVTSLAQQLGPGPRKTTIMHGGGKRQLRLKQ